ncbi:endospore germination permease [Desulfosporosinus sp.]|uniref:GerAB/ArcD/ProY family transporter n=1 Tax=Desulfosporosinus sp. TaxID=157907 RepID=UPI0023145978|nr:endospore germination permease [Desulfosporosinus sp.]MCO5387481.1 endospore germination permease [Desulfosporosinus sp.]MDA8221955.1 endospore germination permease [Desulfitobacterium hafniense]
MRLERGEISSSQLMFLISCFIQGGLFPLSFSYSISKHDTWLALIAAFIIGIFIVLIYIALASKFPGKNIIEINDLIYGPYFGKLVSLQYIYFFIISLSGYLWFIGDFVLTFIMPETPIIVIMTMFTFICAWAVRKGIEVIARLSVIFVFIPGIIILLTFALLLKNMEFTNFLPVFEVPLEDFIQSTNIIMHISVCEVLVFLMVIPYMNKPKQAKRSVLLGIISGGLILLTGIVRNIAALGPLSEIVTDPSLLTVSLINIGKIISRLEVLVSMAEILLLFIITSVFYYAAVLSVAQITKLRSYLPVVIPIGIIGISLSLISYDSRMQFSYSTMYITPLLSMHIYIVIPLMSLIVAKLRKLPQRNGRN